MRGRSVMVGLRSFLQARQATSIQEGGSAYGWPTALARAAREAAGLALGVTSCRVGIQSIGEIMEALPDLSMIAMINGPAEGLGVMVLSPPVLAGTVEWQTLGRVLPSTPAPRKPTRTDAVLVQPMIDRALQRLGAAVDGTDDMIWAAGFRYASCLEDARALALLLDDAPFRVMRAEVALAGGKKSGLVLLAVPAEGRGPAPPPREETSERAAAMVFEAALAEQVNGAKATMDAVIARVSLPLSEVMALSVGEVLHLPGASIDRIDLEAPGCARTAGGKLGQSRGMRAVRVQDEVLPVPRTEAHLGSGFAAGEETFRKTGTR